MRRPGRLIPALGIGLLAVIVLAGSAIAGETRVKAFANDMQGENEVPTPGDPDATGEARLKLDSAGRVCWQIRVRDLTLPATAAHIHEGDAGVAGGILVFLSPPDANGFAEGCTRADAEVVAAIMANPAHYYVNVHNADYPGGALRDQISTS